MLSEITQRNQQTKARESFIHFPYRTHKPVDIHDHVSDECDG